MGDWLKAYFVAFVIVLGSAALAMIILFTLILIIGPAK